MPTPRHIRTVAALGAFFSAGAAVSVAVAWSLEVARAYRDAKRGVVVNGPDRSARHVTIPPPARGVRPIQGSGTVKPARQEWSLTHGPLDAREFRGSLPSWVQLPDPDDAANPPWHRSSGSIAIGWPMLALKYHTHTQRVDLDADTYQFQTTWRRCLRWSDNKTIHIFLPTSPIWTGLFINAAAYGALLSTPWWLKAARRRRRLARGRCQRCGYDLQGDRKQPCPECGASP